jgi:hypothetical protein
LREERVVRQIAEKELDEEQTARQVAEEEAKIEALKRAAEEVVRKEAVAPHDNEAHDPVFGFDVDKLDKQTEIEYISEFANNASQGVCSDGTYIYTTSSSILSKYDKDGVLQTSRDISGDDASNDHIGDLCYHDGFLYIGISNYPTIPLTGSVLKIDASDLSLDSIIATEGNHPAGSVARKEDGTFWAVSFDDPTPVKIYKYSSAWVYQAVYNLESVGGVYAYDGIEWIDEYLFANPHETVATGEYMDKYRFDGTAFYRVERISHIINNKICGQGIGLDPIEDRVLWWAARGDEFKVYKTNINRKESFLHGRP